MKVKLVKSPLTTKRYRMIFYENGQPIHHTDFGSASIIIKSLLDWNNVLFFICFIVENKQYLFKNKKQENKKF